MAFSGLGEYPEKLNNRMQGDVLYLESGNRGEGDRVEHPDDALRVEPVPGGERQTLDNRRDPVLIAFVLLARETARTWTSTSKTRWF